MATIKDYREKERYIRKANQVEEQYGIPHNLLVGLLKTESNLNPQAVNPASGAKGLAQFMKDTAKEYGINPYNPSQSIEAAGKYLANSYKKLGNWQDSIRSYNMGLQGVLDWKAGKRKLPKETAEYAGKIYKNAKIDIGNQYSTPIADEEIRKANEYFQYQPTTDVKDLPISENNTILADNSEEKDKDLEEVQQQTKEYNFLQEYQNIVAQQEQPQQVEEPVVQEQIPQQNLEDIYNQVSEFVDSNVAQQGGITQFFKKPIQPLDERNQVQRDITQVKTQKARTLQQLNVRNKTDKEIATEREAKIRASVEAQKVPYTKENWRRQLAAETVATGDKLRVSNKPNFFDDYVNPAAMIGNMASNLGQAPLQAEQSNSILPYITSIGAPLAVGAMAGLGTQNTGQFVNNLANPLAGFGVKDRVLDVYRIGKGVAQNPKVFLKEVSENITDNVIEPVLQQKSRREITKIFNSKIDELNNPRSIQKLEEAGIDSSLFLQDLKKTKLNFTKKGSSMFKFDDYAPTLNFDINQAKKLRQEGYNLSNESVVDHEIGHLMQPIEFRNQKGVSDLISIGKLKSSGTAPTAIDLESDILLKDANTILDSFSEHNKKYFNDAYKPTLDRNPIKGVAEYWQKTERLPFLRETKRELIDAGLINNINSEITPQILKEFRNNTKGNRILSFLPYKEESFINLSNLLNKTPAIIPIAGASYLATQGQKELPIKQQGGNVIDTPIAQQGIKVDISEMLREMSRENKNLRRTPQIQIFNKPKVLPEFDIYWEAPRPQIKLKDTRAVSATTGKPINPNKDLVTDSYDRDTIRDITLSANKHGVDPYTALAVGLQETGLGKSDSNIGHIIGKHKGLSGNAIDDFVKTIKEKQEYANRLGIKDEETTLQAYNGLGKIYPQTEKNYHGYEMKQIYGVDVPKGGIDMRKNPLYGKRIVDLRDNVLRANPSLVDYVDTISPKINPFTGKVEEHQDIPQFQQGGKTIIKDQEGQRKYPNQVTEIQGNSMSTSGYGDIPLYVVPDVGEPQIIQANTGNYSFPNATKFTEYPLTNNEQKFLKHIAKIR